MALAVKIQCSHYALVVSQFFSSEVSMTFISLSILVVPAVRFSIDLLVWFSTAAKIFCFVASIAAIRLSVNVCSWLFMSSLC